MQHARRFLIPLAAALTLAVGCSREEPASDVTAVGSEAKSSEESKHGEEPELPPDADVLQRSQGLEDGFYAVIFPKRDVTKNKHSGQELEKAEKTAEKAREDFPDAQVVVNPGVPDSELVSGDPPGGYIVMLEGPFADVPDGGPPGAIADWNMDKKMKVKEKDKDKDLEEIDVVYLTFSNLEQAFRDQ